MTCRRNGMVNVNGLNFISFYSYSIFSTKTWFYNTQSMGITFFKYIARSRSWIRMYAVLTTYTKRREWIFQVDNDKGYLSGNLKALKRAV